jgi:hypothetical protein
MEDPDDEPFFPLQSRARLLNGTRGAERRKKEVELTKGVMLEDLHSFSGPLIRRNSVCRHLVLCWCTQ